MADDKLLLLFNELLEELNNGNGFAGLMKQLSRFFSCDSLLTDDIYQTLAYVTADGKSLPSDLVEVHGDHAFCVYNNLKNETWEAHCHPLIDQEILIGYLFFPKSLLGEIGSNIDAVTSQLAKFILLEQRKQLELKQMAKKYKESFIYDLLYGNMKSHQDIISKGELWGVNFSLPHTVIVFELNDYEEYSMDNQILDKVFRIFETNLLSMGIVPMCLKKREEIILILQVKDKDRLSDRRRHTQQVIDVLKNEASRHVKGRVLTIGVGRTYEQPSELFRSYQEAKVASILEGNALPSDVTFFSDIGLLKLLYNHDLQELKEFERDILGELESFDQQTDMELIETLEGYIKNNCDLKLASQAMFLHRNTLRYRLNKIEELLQVNIHDLQTIINFAVALKIKRLDR